MARVNRIFLAIAIVIPIGILSADGDALPSPDNLTMNVVNHDDPGAITDAEKPDAGVRLAGNPNTGAGPRDDRTPSGGGIKRNPQEDGGSGEKNDDGREKDDDTSQEKDDDSGSQERDDDSQEKDDDSQERDDDSRDGHSHEKDDDSKGKKEKSD